MSTASTLTSSSQSMVSNGNGSGVSLNAKENEWVAPQFHRKVHVNNRIYIEGAGIEKLGYERLTEYFSRWGKVYNVELKVNNRDGRRQKKVYGFVTFSEEQDAQNCIDAAKAGIEIEPGRPLSVRAAFFMPRRNSFETEKVAHQNWQNSTAPNEPTIHSRSPSPDFTTGEWKPEMANQVNGSNYHKQPLSVEEQAKKLFEIFQNLPEHAQHRILQILMAQKYQEQQLAAIKESRNQVIEDLSSGNVPANNGPDLSQMFGALQMGPAKEPERVRLPEPTGLRDIPQRNGMMNGDSFAQNGTSNANPLFGATQAKPPITLPRYVPQADRQGVNGYQTVAQSHVSQSNGISVSQSQQRQAPQYNRQYSDTVFESQNGFNNNGFNNMPPSAAPRPIKKLQREDNALGLTIPESFGASSPAGAWAMPNSPPNDDFFMAPGRSSQRLADFSQY